MNVGTVTLWSTVAAIGFLSGFSPLFGGRDLNEVHVTVQVVMGALILAFALSQAVAGGRGGRSPIALVVAALGVLYALLPWLVPSLDPGPLGQFHDHFHVLPGALIAGLVGWAWVGERPQLSESASAGRSAG
jgi:hypothetical protein